jgi:hypothetical protein
MPLLALWTAEPKAIGESTIEQVVAIAGDGNLKDSASCSQELREYLTQIPSKKLALYVEHCLSSGFSKSGMVLQDLINELGRRLDYKVTNGRYQGTTNAIGFDGLWISPEGHSIIAEVKTTDTYRISLDTISRYREKLLASGEVGSHSSILIVVGRDDTGELEAQVRGSRHAWDIRLISADALLKLVQLKENADGPETGRKIRSLLTPMEYTRLDEMVDVMFTTATDVEAAMAENVTEEQEEGIPAVEAENESKGVWQFTDSGLLQAKREQIIAGVEKAFQTKLIKRSRALYWDASHAMCVATTISKRYTRRPSHPYWYAYHPQWDEFLQEGTQSFLVLGCMDLNFAFAIPRAILFPHLGSLNTTTTDRSTYWHLHITEPNLGEYALLLPREPKNLLLNEYRVAIENPKQA